MLIKRRIKHFIAKFLFRFREINGNGASSADVHKLLYDSKLPLPELYELLGTDENGLLGIDARERLEKCGPNEVAYEKPPTWYELLIRSYLNPFNVLLSILGSIYYFTGDTDGTIIILIMVTVSVLIRFFQEYRSLIAAEKLKAMVQTKATVIRKGDLCSPEVKYELPMEDLVPEI